MFQRFRRDSARLCQVVPWGSRQVNATRLGGVHPQSCGSRAGMVIRHVCSGVPTKLFTLSWVSTSIMQPLLGSNPGPWTVRSGHIAEAKGSASAERPR
eukprot:264750-Chlamydomonas_euryale.AAC.6